jgi:LuxR family transcriptional regulator, maltose regulon positive regulatory protein
MSADAGAPDRAEQAAREAIALARHPRRREHFAGAIAYLALGTVQRARGRSPDAGASLDRAAELARHGAGSVETAAVLLGRARLAVTERDETRAADLIGQAGEIISGCPDPAGLGPLHAALLRHLRPSPSCTPVGGGPPALTDRELAVVRLLARDLTRREIGATLFVSPNTVKTHLRNINRKLGATTSPEIIRKARALGLI